MTVNIQLQQQITPELSPLCLQRHSRTAFTARRRFGKNCLARRTPIQLATGTEPTRYTVA